MTDKPDHEAGCMVHVGFVDDCLACTRLALADAIAAKERAEAERDQWHTDCATIGLAWAKADSERNEARAKLAAIVACASEVMGAKGLYLVDSDAMRELLASTETEPGDD